MAKENDGAVHHAHIAVNRKVMYNFFIHTQETICGFCCPVLAATGGAGWGLYVFHQFSVISHIKYHEPSN